MYKRTHLVASCGLLIAAAMSGCASPEQEHESYAQLSSAITLASDPWIDPATDEVRTPRYVQLPHVILPVVDKCDPPGPLSVITNVADTTSRKNLIPVAFREIALPKARMPELRRLPGQDMTWDDPNNGASYSVEELGDGMCRWQFEQVQGSYTRRAYVWAQEFEVYNKNVTLETWYSVVDSWGEAGEALAEDYVKSGGFLQDLGILSAGVKTITDGEAAVVDAVYFFDSNVVHPDPDANTVGGLTNADEVVTAANLCSDALKDLKIADHLKAVQLGVMTWGLTIDAVTHIQKRLGLLPETEEYHGERTYLFALSYDEPERNLEYYRVVYSDETFPCGDDEAGATASGKFADLLAKLPSAESEMGN